MNTIRKRARACQIASRIEESGRAIRDQIQLPHPSQILGRTRRPQKQYRHACDAEGCAARQFSTTFDANNHVSDGSVSYDAAGNVMQDAFNTYTYDSQNQMISSLSRSSGSLTCYFYDAYGRRVQKATGATSCGYPFVGGTSLYYVYDTAGNMIDEVSAPSGGTGNWTWQEIYAAGRHLATFNASAGQAYWDFSDWLGTERARVNAVTGAVAETCTSLPWGDNLQCTGTDQSPLHFTGKQRDSESGLDDFGARYNSSALGRFMTPDWSPTPSAVPFGDDADPQSLNLYLYVRDNPLGRTDPTGHCDVDGETRGAFWCFAHLFGLVSTKKEDEARQAQQQKKSDQPSSWDKTKRMPDDPSKLGPEWKKNPDYKNPNGEEYVNDKTGEKMEWNKGRKGPWGPKADRGKDGWHYTPPGGVRGKQMDPGTVLKAGAKIGFWGAAGAITIKVIETGVEACAEGACY